MECDIPFIGAHVDGDGDGVVDIIHGGDGNIGVGCCIYPPYDISPVSNDGNVSGGGAMESCASYDITRESPYGNGGGINDDGD